MFLKPRLSSAYLLTLPEGQKEVDREVTTLGITAEYHQATT